MVLVSSLAACKPALPSTDLADFETESTLLCAVLEMGGVAYDDPGLEFILDAYSSEARYPICSSGNPTVLGAVPRTSLVSVA